MHRSTATQRSFTSITTLLTGITLSLTAAAALSQSAVFEWDPAPANTPATPDAQGGTGDWDTGGTGFWDGTTNMDWTEANTAIFGGTGGNVTVVGDRIVTSTAGIGATPPSAASGGDGFTAIAFAANHDVRSHSTTSRDVRVEGAFVVEIAGAGLVTFGGDSNSSLRINLGDAIRTFQIGTEDTLRVTANIFSTTNNLGGMRKTGAGTLTLAAATDFTGATTIASNGGTLEINHDGGVVSAGRLNTSALTVNSGGTLTLSGSSTVSDHINDTAFVTLSGGTINTGGLSEHGALNNTPGIGALTLSSNPILDLGHGASVIAFRNSNRNLFTGINWTSTLKIYNWTGNPLNGGGSDQIYFGNDATGLSANQLQQIQFYSGFGTGAYPPGAIILSTGEIVPAPEPAPTPSCLPDSLCPDWVARYDEAALYDHAFDILTSPDGSRVYVTGASTSTAGARDFVTLAYNAATGQQLWEARYDGPAHGNDFPAGSSALGNALALSKDGTRIFVTGQSPDANGKNDYLTIAYDAADGAELWISRYSTAQESIANGLVLSGDGERLYVTGYSAAAIAAPPAPEIANYDFGTVAYDTATGQELWVARYDGPAAFWDIAYSIGVASVRQPDDTLREQVFVIGRSNGASAANNHADFATAAYDGATGDELWVTRYDGPASDRDLAYAIETSPDGSSVFVTGESVGNGTSSDYATISYNAVTGASQWTTRYEQGDLDLALALAVSPSGDRVAVTGFSVNPGALTVIDRSAATISYNAATGAQVWAARHTEVDGAAASELRFSRDGRRLYVAGLQNGNVIGVGGGGVGGQVGHAPALTLAYEAPTGAEIWATHYSGPAGDEGNSGLAISPDGAHVFVTGGGQSQGADFATLSYTTGAPVPPAAQLAKVVSSKTHGAAGTFEIDLPHTGGNPTPGIECRSGGANGDYSIIFSFVNPLTFVGTVSTSCGSVASSSVDSERTQAYVVNLTGVDCNAVTVTVVLGEVHDSAGNYSSSVSTAMALLLGDTTANASVNSSDISQTKSQSGQAVTSSNFRQDVTVNGSINSSDISLVKSKSGTALP